MSELTDFEHEVLNCIEDAVEGNYSPADFIGAFRQIMPPTCTENERKFLDKLKEAKSLMMTVITAEGIESYDVDFKKMIEGEDE